MLPGEGMSPAEFRVTLGSPLAGVSCFLPKDSVHVLSVAAGHFQSRRVVFSQFSFSSKFMKFTVQRATALGVLVVFSAVTVVNPQEHIFHPTRISKYRSSG
jgi:hypothetical protein